MQANEGMHSTLPSPFDLHMAGDTIPPLKDRVGDFTQGQNQNPFDLRDPKIVDQSIEFDPETNSYKVTERLGDDYFRMPSYMSFEEYLDYKAKEQERIHFQRLAGINSAGGEVGPDIDPIKKFDLSNSLIDRLFGGTVVDLQPKGTIGITLGYVYQHVENQRLNERQQRNGGLDFDMDIQMNMDGQIGDKLKLNANYNTKSTFAFDQQLKLQYDSEAFSEDEILKKIEAGNVSLPLRSTLIQGGQSLFGFKTDLQFGRLRLTTLISQQQSEKKDLQIEKGAQIQDFEIEIDEYDENRHFFLSHFARTQFEPGLQNLPQITSLVNITKVEVWVTNNRRETENTRDIIALADLGETQRMTTDNPRLQPSGMIRNPDISGQYELPDNEANPIYRELVGDDRLRDAVTAFNSLSGSPYNLVPSKDMERTRARKLRESEYTLNTQLGFISINTSLQPDQILGIAYEYTYNGEKFQVGELSTDFPSETEDASVLFVKMLKSTTQRTDVPLWDLMMKNVYSIQAYQVTREDFYLDVFYEEPGKGEKRFIPTEDPNGSQPLLRLLNLDNLNPLGDPQPDGAFDFVPGVTIFPSTGKMMFPVLEPFGSSLANQFKDPAVADNYIFQQLYDSSIFIAQEFAELNRFTIRARFKSSATNEYSLGAFNVPPGSVRVTAGGQVLIEGQDYDVDYNLGKVRIINDAYINSSVPINVSYEDNATFSLNRKTMLGLRADYEVSKHLNLGFTFMHLFERPYTQKVNIGEDPINNRIFGLDLNYSKEAPFLTRLVDAIPLIDTKAPSNITFAAEGAIIKPGHSKAINQEGTKSGTILIDDFEGSSIGIDLRNPANEWVIASVPQNDNLNNNPKFPESALNNDLQTGVNRALINWYRIEPRLQRNDNDRGNPFTQPVSQQAIFPNRSSLYGFDNNIQVFDVHYDPQERGPYNFDEFGGTAYSAGLSSEGKLIAPETRWGGIMRDLRNTDFQAANIEYIEFWVMNPYAADTISGTRLNSNGKIYLNLGNISEDILKDSRMSYENGLPTDNSLAPVAPTAFGQVPVVQDITSAFSIDEAERVQQDVGYDGLDDEAEKVFFAEYIERHNDVLLADAKEQLRNDPSNDNFIHYRNYPENVSIFERYSKFNNTQGNSKASTGNQLQSSTNYPDKEDLNNDNTVNESEAYYEYEIPIEYDGQGGLALNEFITDTIRATGSGPVWYRFLIPREQHSRTVGSIRDFRSIRFIRMYFSEFSEPVTFRFAKFDLVRNQWRKYNRSLSAPGPGEVNNGPSGVEFDISSVNIEENSRKFPFGYVLPPGVLREQAVGTYNSIQRNEQSLALNICNLPDGEAAAMFKNLNEDFRNFDSLQMFVHAEVIDDEIIDPGETSLFIRLGSDYVQNYYEYEIPLTMSDPDAADTTLFDDLDELVWLKENRLNVPLQLMKDLKIERNNSGIPFNIVHSIQDPESENNFVRIIGNPNLGLVKGIMIGVRNRRDDGMEKCLEVWVNELRLSGLNEEGGTAGLARLDLQLADFGRLSLSGNYSSIGWGSLDQKLAERSLEESIQYDVATNLSLGKFFGDNSGLEIPFYAQYSSTQLNPKFDPYDRDIELKEKIRQAPTEERDSIRAQAVDNTTIKSFNFTNVRKNRTGGNTPKPWDIANFSATYAQSEIERRDPIIESDKTEEKRGSLDYQYSSRAKYVQPFKGLAKNSKVLKWLTEFNFNPLPNSLAISSALTRLKSTKSYRFSEPEFKTWYTKRFVWERNYDLNWDFAKSLKFRFNATNNSVIDELEERDPDFSEVANRELIKEGLRNFGRNKDYAHNLNLSYNVPLQHFPVLDFATIKATATSSYGWNAAALNVLDLGNVIQNQQSRTLSGDFNFEKLYNNIPYLRKINRTNSRSTGRSRGTTNRPPRNQGDDDKDRKGGDRDPGGLERLFIRPLMALRRARFQYSENLGTVVPGFMPSIDYFGMGRNWTAPGYEFVLGFQPDDEWFNTAIRPENKWISESVFLNQEVILNKNKKWNAQLSIEPFDDFKLEVTWDYSFTENHSEYFKKARPDADFARLAPRDVGSFNITYYTLGTLFNSDVEGLFTAFEQNRSTISQRVGETGTQHPKDGGEYTFGYGKYQRDVLIPAFISSYAKIPASEVKLDIFNQIPKPNWNLTYNGLSKVPFFKDIFSNVSLSHGYRSTLSVNSYNTDYDYTGAPDNFNEVTGDYYSRFEIPDITIQEQMSPLLGLNVKTRNDVSLSVNMNKSRNLSLSFTDYQLNETKRTDYTASFGYIIKDVYIGFLQPKSKKRTQRSQRDQQEEDPDGDNPNQGGKAPKGNNMEIRFDFSYGDNELLLHRFDTEKKQESTRGSKQIRISPSVLYDLSETLSLRLFVDYNRSQPYGGPPPITNFNSGVTIQFALQ